MTAANGTRFGLRVDFHANFSPGNRSNNPSPSKSIRGSGAVCSKDGKTGGWKLAGTVTGAWASTDGKTVSFVFFPEGDPKLVITALRLEGHFTGNSIVVDGSSAPTYAAAVPEDGLLSAGDKKGVRGRFESGDEHSFEGMCADLRRGVQ